MYIYIFNLLIQVNACIHGCIWPYIPNYTPFWHLRGALDPFSVHSHPGSWCTLHPANTAMVQHHPTSLQSAVAPTQLPRNVEKQLSKALYKRLNKLNLSMCIHIISGRNVLPPSRSMHRPLGKGSGMYKR